MSDPITAAMIGASIGAVGGAATGNNPLKGALLGAGAGYGGSSLLGAGGLGGTSAATGAVGTTGEIGGANLLTGATGAGGSLSSGLGVAPTLMDKAGQFMYNLPSNAIDYAKANPLSTASLGMSVYDRVNPQQPQTQAPQIGIIRQQQTGQYQPVLQARLPQTTYPRRLV